MWKIIIKTLAAHFSFTTNKASHFLGGRENYCKTIVGGRMEEDEDDADNWIKDFFEICPTFSSHQG